MYNTDIARKTLEAQIEGMRKRFEIDVEAGRRDAKGGIYDKWYREHRKDAGAAYDAGWRDEYAKAETVNFQIIG